MLAPAKANFGHVLCDGPDDFISRADRWTRREPFPLLPGPSLDRYATLFPDGKLPPVEDTTRDGIVVSAGSEVARAAGRLLAVATGRTHQHIAVAERLIPELAIHTNETVAVVGLVDDLSAAGDWPGTSGARVGVLACRSADSLACLVYRSLTVGAALDDRVFVSSHPLLPGTEDADAVSASELEYVRGHRAKLLILRGLGRECCSGLIDTMICGKSTPPGAVSLPMAPESRMTPCLRGAGCFRSDLTEDDLVPAADVHAGVIFAHSCSAIALGANAYPQEISVTLSLLEGTAVAVIGAMGMHVAQRSAEWQLEEGLGEGQPLGDIVYRLSAHGYPFRGDLARFGLLGDPGLVMPWTAATARHKPSGASVSPKARLGEAALAQLTHLDQTIIPRLERLRWLDIDIPDADLLAIRRHIRNIAHDPFDPDADAAIAAVTDDLANLQFHTAERMVETIYTRGWNFGGSAFYGMEQIARRDVTCPNCAAPRAVRLVLRHRVERDLHVQTLNCRRCADLVWSTEPDGTDIVIDGRFDIDADRLTPIDVEFKVTNFGAATVRGAVGFAFRNRRAFGLPSGTSLACDLAPKTHQTFHIPMDFRDYNARPDTHTGPFITLLDGVYRASVVRVRLS